MVTQKETKEKEKSSRENLGKLFYDLAKTSYAAMVCIYLQLFVSTHLEDIDTPWNYIAYMTLIICNGLLAVYFFGKPEKDNNK